MIKEYLGRDTRQLVLDVAIEQGSFVSASGDLIEQKIDFDNIKEGTFAWFLCINGLAQCVHENFGPSRSTPRRLPFDAVISVGSGATRLGDPMAEEFRVRHIPALKNDDGVFGIDADVRGVKKAVVLDDVFRRGTNTGKVTGVAHNFGIQVVGVATVFNRSSNPFPELQPGIPVYSAIYINMDDEPYRKAL